jgi:hypothetical protein
MANAIAANIASKPANEEPLNFVAAPWNCRGPDVVE